jgi:hypothetical protein
VRYRRFSILFFSSLVGILSLSALWQDCLILVFVKRSLKYPVYPNTILNSYRRFLVQPILYISVITRLQKQSHFLITWIIKELQAWSLIKDDHKNA